MMRQFIEYLQQFRYFQRNTRLYLLQSALVGIAVGAFLLLYPLYLSELGYSLDRIGLVLFFTPLGAGVGILPAGLCIDRISHKAILIWSSAMLAIGALGQILLHGPLLLCISGFIVGIGGSCQYVLNAPFLTKNSTLEERPHLFSLNLVLLLATTVLGQLLGGIFPSVLAQWLQLHAHPFASFSGLSWLFASKLLARSYQITVLCGILIACTGFIPLFLMTADRPTSARSERQPLWRVLFFPRKIWQASGKNVMRDTITRQDATAPGATLSFWSRLRGYLVGAVACPSPLVIMTGSCMLAGIGSGILLPYVGLFFVKHLGANSALFGIVDGSSNALLALATLLSPLLVMRIGRLNTIVVTSLLSLPVLLGTGAFPLLWLAAFLYPLFVILWNMSNGIWQLFGMEVVPEKLQGRANSSYLVAFQGGSAVATPIGGLLLSHLGYMPVFWMTAGLYFLSMVLIWWRFAGKRFGEPQACVETTKDGQKEDEEARTSGDGLVTSDGDVINSR